MPHPLAGHRAPASLLIDVARARAGLLRGPPGSRQPGAARELRHQRPPRHAARRHASPRRTSWRSPRRSASYRAAQGITGPLYPGQGHARRVAARRERTALEVLAANGVDDGHRARRRLHADAGRLARDPRAQRAAAAPGLADGIVITPSHNPPADGGFKYNPPDGGPADTDVTGWIQDRANALLARRQRRRAARAARARAQPPRRRTQDDLVEPVRRRPGGARSTWTRSARPACGSAWIRWAARRSRYWPRDRRALRARPHRGEPGDRPDVRAS